MTMALARATPNDPMPLILLALIVGFAFIFGATYYAVTPKQPMPHRWAAQIVCLASALGLVLLCLHATWRFRHR